MAGLNLKAPLDPSSLSLSDRLGILGAAFGQLGGDKDALVQQQGLLAQRQQQAHLTSLLGQLNGTPAQSAIPSTGDTGLDGALTDIGIGPREAAPAQPVADAQKDRLLNALSFISPEIGNSVRANMEKHFSIDPKSGLRLEQGTGETSAVPGYAPAVAAVTGADTNASENAKANYSLPTLPMSNGGSFTGLPTNAVIQNLPTLLAQGIGVGQGTAAKEAATAAGRLPFVGPTAQAQAAGSAAGGAPYELVDVPVMGPDGRPTGETTKTTRAALLGLVGGGGQPAQNLPALPGQRGPAARAPAASPTVPRTMSPAAQAGATDMEKNYAARFNTDQTDARSAQTALAQYRQIDKLLGSFEGGGATAAQMNLASLANSLGVKIDPKLGNKQAAQALASQLTLSNLGGHLGSGVSNADVAFIGQTNPGLAQSASGRKEIIRMGEAVAQRKMDVAAKQRAWVGRFGSLGTRDGSGKGFDDYAAAWADANPLFGRH